MSLPNTHLGPDAIARILDGKENIFFDGIGGVSMNALAHVSHIRGYKVSGYDRTPSETTKKLEKIGIKVYYEADAAHVADCDALVYTVAMPEDNPEYAYAQEHGIPLISRADFLGYIMTDYRHRIGVSGTHGKSTTTGMIAHILSSANLSPTVLNGAEMKETGTVDMIGSHEYFVFESCEYMDSFLDFYPTVAVVLNIELDHVDYFKSMEQMRTSYTSFMNKTGREGLAVININDKDCVAAAEKYNGHTVTFAHDNPEAEYYSANEVMTDGYPEFDIMHNGKTVARVKLHVPGEHCISDALAAYAACSEIGVPDDAIASGLSSYEGICRRMDKVYVTKKGAAVYTDYGHHPTEISVTLRGARRICRRKMNVVFQPHTFSRLAELIDGFVSAFSESGADEIVLLDVYAAREINTFGVTSRDLSEMINARGKKCRVAEDFASAAEYLNEISADGDMIVVMGAGDVISVADIIKEKY